MSALDRPCFLAHLLEVHAQCEAEVAQQKVQPAMSDDSDDDYGDVYDDGVAPSHAPQPEPAGAAKPTLFGLGGGAQGGQQKPLFSFSTSAGAFSFSLGAQGVGGGSDDDDDEEDSEDSEGEEEEEEEPFTCDKCGKEYGDEVEVFCPLDEVDVVICKTCGYFDYSTCLTCGLDYAQSRGHECTEEGDEEEYDEVIHTQSQPHL